MKAYYLVFGLLLGSLVTWALMLILQPVPEQLKHVEPRVSTSEVMGNCIQAQRVLYHVDRGRAAGTCAFELSENRTQFFRNWKNYKTEEGLW